MTTYLGKSCSFGFPRVPFVNCRQFMYLVISLLVLRAGLWDLIGSVPDHNISFYFVLPANNEGTDQTVCIMDHDADHFTFESEHDKTNKMTRARSEDSGQSGQTGRMPRLI